MLISVKIAARFQYITDIPSFLTRCDIQTFDSNTCPLPNTPLYMASSTPISIIPGSENRIADLIVISYEKLLRKDSTEAALLLSACADSGFFYLDFGGSKGDNYRKTVDELFSVSQEYFVKPIEEKLKDMRDEEMEVFNICG